MIGKTAAAIATGLQGKVLRPLSAPSVYQEGAPITLIVRLPAPLAQRPSDVAIRAMPGILIATMMGWVASNSIDVVEGERPLLRLGCKKLTFRSRP